MLVGMTGFEPAASSSRTKRATGLRYIPRELWLFRAAKVIISLICKSIFNEYFLESHLSSGVGNWASMGSLSGY